MTLYCNSFKNLKSKKKKNKKKQENFQFKITQLP